ncbi:MAG: phenylacetate--CoA ligase family protein [Spirochaetota bacterium]
MYNPEYELLPVDELKKLQLQRMQETVRRTYQNNEYFRKKYDSAGFHPDDLKSLDDVKHIPFMEKQEMRDNYPYGLFASPLSDVVRIHSSSGTTGNATVVGYTRNDIDVWAELCARTLAAAGAGKDDIVQVAYGYGLFTGGLGIHYGAEKLGAVTVPISGGNTARQIMLVRDLHSTVLACTPSYALNLIDYVEKSNLDFDFRSSTLKYGIFGAEPWSDSMRAEIEERMGIDAYDIYGLSEVIGPGVSIECSQKQGLHVFEDHFYVETINPETGEVLPEGETGEIVYTSLTKECSPVIRYRSRDITRLFRDSCPCGRTSVKMEKVTGRSDDMLIIRGVNVFPSQIETVLMSVDGVKPHYQIIVDRQSTMDDVEIQVEVNEAIFSDELKVMNSLKLKIEDAVKGTLGISSKVILVEPQTIERSMGKAKRVIDRRQIEKGA